MNNRKQGSWDTIRSALEVARCGSLSQASKQLNVHHSTVLRHIAEIERDLGVKLFHRHSRGYALTHAGKEFAVGAERMENAAAQILHRTEIEHEETSRVVIDATAVLNPIMTDAIAWLKAARSDIAVEVINNAGNLRLDLGEADVALRSSAERPDEPDYVVLAAPRLAVSLFASTALDLRPEGIMFEHLPLIVSGGSNKGSASQRWLNQHHPSVGYFVETDDCGLGLMLIKKSGVGFLPTVFGRAQEDLVELMPPKPEWAEPVWICTHRETHRTARVQIAVRALRRVTLIHGLMMEQ